MVAPTVATGLRPVVHMTSPRLVGNRSGLVKTSTNNYYSATFGSNDHDDKCCVARANHQVPPSPSRVSHSITTLIFIGKLLYFKGHPQACTHTQQCDSDESITL